MIQILAIAILGIAAGFVATRVLRIEADPVTTGAIGILGTLGGFLAVRFLIGAVTILGVLAAAFAGAFVLAWAWERYGTRRR